MSNTAKIILIKKLCLRIVTRSTREDIIYLGSIIKEKDTWPLLQVLLTELISTFYAVLREVFEVTEDQELLIIDLLDHVLSHTKFSQIVVFFNIFGYLLQKIYDCERHQIENISEDYKIAILSCVKSLLNSTVSELTINIYSKENGKRLCKMIYVAVMIASNEKFKDLRIRAIECLMALFKVYSDDDYCDILYRSLVAECFSYFLPGVSICLKIVALGNINTGFKLIKIAIKAMGRICSLLMQDYKSDDLSVNSLEQAKLFAQNCLSEHNNKQNVSSKNIVDDYMENLRDPKWFKKSDRHLAKIFMGFRKLTQHQMSSVRYELAEMCILFIQNCFRTMPESQRFFVEILIILSEDDDSQISKRTKHELNKCTKIVMDEQNIFFANALQSGFYETFSEIPKVFNGIDDKDKNAILKLTSGYVNLFGPKLHLNECFKEFMLILLHLCTFQIDISTFEENIILDMENDDESETSSVLKNLKYLSDESLRIQFSNSCNTLVKNDLFEVLTDFIIAAYQNEEERKEATFLLNMFISGLKHKKCTNKIELIKPIFNMYIDSNNWNVPVSKSDLEDLTLRTLRSNIQQVALHVRGLGVMAEVLEEEYRPFLLQSLFLILTRAGSEQPLIAEAGKKALKSVAKALQYQNSIALINSNMDYFVFYIERSLKSASSEEKAFDVLEVIIIYGNKTTFNNLTSIIEEVLVQSCDRYKQKNIDAYLRIFQIFVKNLFRWFDVTIPPHEMKTKAQKKEEELQSFQITGLENTTKIIDFSDEIMGKTAEDLYKEDMERRKEEIEKETLEPEVEEYKKPKSPDHVKLTVEILKRALNFLPSKEQERQLVVLEILRDGVEIIKGYEDELLPITHLIWSPLVGRFKNIEAPVIINYSFQLLCTLGRVSRDFIRNRTAKDVLPSVLEVLKKLSTESYMKDRGSAYRYTQSYKLQSVILEKLVYLVTDVDLLENDIKKVMDVIFIYLNNKQPLPLQVEAVNFFDRIIHYDGAFEEKISEWYREKVESDDFKKNLRKILKYES